jgi:hypothetical protein
VLDPHWTSQASFGDVCTTSSHMDVHMSSVEHEMSSGFRISGKSSVGKISATCHTQWKVMIGPPVMPCGRFW